MLKLKHTALLQERMTTCVCIDGAAASKAHMAGDLNSSEKTKGKM